MRQKYSVAVMESVISGLFTERAEERPAGIAEDLIRIGGKMQVPCLAIDGKGMYKSDDIIAHLRGGAY